METVYYVLGIIYVCVAYIFCIIISPLGLFLMLFEKPKICCVCNKRIDRKETWTIYIHNPAHYSCVENKWSYWYQFGPMDNPDYWSYLGRSAPTEQ